MNLTRDLTIYDPDPLPLLSGYFKINSLESVNVG